METIHNYIHVDNVNLNLDKVKNSCFLMQDFIKYNISNKPVNTWLENNNSTATTSLFSEYNVLLYPYEEFYELYQTIQKTFHKVCSDKETKFYIQCWLNVYEKGQYIDLHSHWEPKIRSWHGFYCVDVEPSVTTYHIPNIKDPVDVNNRNNTIVISKSAGDQHRTWPWPYEDRPRITVAFDIIPREYINPNKWKNHWVPI